MLPRLLCRGLVITRRRIVMKAMVGAFVDVSLMRHMRLGERRVESRPPIGNPGIEFGVLGVHRRLYFGGVGGAGLHAVKGHRGGKIRTHPHCQLIDNAAAKAKADSPKLADAVWP